jgi:hypothetical protein
MTFSIIEIPIHSKSLATTEKSEHYFASVRVRTGYLFLALCLSYFVLSWLTNTMLLTENVYYNTFSERLSLEQIETFTNLQSRYAFLGYGLIFPSLLLKVTYTAVCLAVAAVLADWDFSFGDIFKVALIAELVFLVGAVIQFVWCLLFFNVNVLADVTGFYPLSLLNFFDMAHLEPWRIYPLRTLNLFEVAYCFFLIHLLRNRYKHSFKATVGLVFGGYGFGLFIWVLIVMFVNVLLS